MGGGEQLQSCSSKQFAQKGVWSTGSEIKISYCRKTQTTILGQKLQYSIQAT